jgi:hypothetical protein
MVNRERPPAYCDGALASGKIVRVKRYIAGLIGLGDDMVAEVVTLGGFGVVRIVGFDEPVQSVVLIAGNIAARIGAGNPGGLLHAHKAFAQGMN